MLVRIGWKNVLIMGLACIFLVTGFGVVRSMVQEEPQPESGEQPRLLLNLMRDTDADTLERAPVYFDHTLHTNSLKSKAEKDCKVCHRLEQEMDLKTQKTVRVYAFPKAPYDESDHDALMLAYHGACGDCHRKMASEGKKSGPDIGQCAACHDRRTSPVEVEWAWSPLFNYKRHYQHLEAAKKQHPDDELAQCGMCHHQLDEQQKKLVYKKDGANACTACHQDKTTKEARSLKKVAHAACIDCHMERAAKGEQKTGPFVCKGCHQDQNPLTAEEIKQIPRLKAGQKDVVTVVRKDPKSARMKAVVFDHKAHEKQGQFCNTCHHHSLEKCANCHTPDGDGEKGGGVPYERAYHMAGAQQSCVGCHDTIKQGKNCAGCHQWLTGDLPNVSCPVCHTGPDEGGKPADVPPIPLEFDKEKVPDVIRIRHMENEYEPARLEHQKIIKKLVEISNKNSMARVFHDAAGGQDALCRGCHHHTDLKAAKKLPPCSSCHTRRFNASDFGRPGMLAAYHRQCMGCHTAMDQKPYPLQCEKCHKPKKPLVGVTMSPVRGVTPPMGSAAPKDEDDLSSAGTEGDQSSTGTDEAEAAPESSGAGREGEPASVAETQGATAGQ